MNRKMWNLLKYVWNHPLNAHGKLAALWRVLRWQIASRLMPGLIALPYAQGTSLFATRGMTGATGNWYCGLHEVHEMAFVLHLLRPAEHFVDVGANIGSYTVLAGGAVKARVTAVEPIPATFAHLQRNVALNGMGDGVRCCQVGLSDKPGTLRFSSDLDTVNHVLAEGEDLPGVDVPVTRLDDLVGQDVPVLMKIDVEGHELAVLHGGVATLGDERLLAVIMETNGSGVRYGVSDDQLIAVMRGHGFAPFGYDPFGRRLVDVMDASGNTVFVRDKAAVEGRVKAAPTFRLVNGEI
jgi:FkbM family methyltransferase